MLKKKKEKLNVLFEENKMAAVLKLISDRKTYAASAQSHE